jgi:C1A family cysteine protease
MEGYYFLKESVIDVINALQYGPVVTALYVPKSFKYYSSGVFETNECFGKTKYSVNHSALIVGYDLDAETPYFEMLNSWDDDWGDRGYFKIKLGKLSESNKGHCLVAGTPFMIMPYLQ